LNAEESVQQFLAHAESLVDASVKEYRRRKFNNLMVSFGCTGGQHRSVYLAERLAEHLRSHTAQSHPGRSGSPNGRTESENDLNVIVRHVQLENMGR
jgi:RNase adaptor protein for sRNA GlmZ degradation